MSCRQWVSSAARQCQSALSQQQQPRSFSTSAAVAILRRNIPGSNTPADRSDGPGPSYRRILPSQSGETPRSRFGARTNPNAALQGLVADGMDRGGPLTGEEQRQVLRQQQQGGLRPSTTDMRMSVTSDNYLRQLARRWKIGDVYAPHDLSPAEQRKWRVGKRPDVDVVDMLGFNPLDNYKNFALISEFISTMGRIQHSTETGLRPVNQRKMAKAIRRAIGMGLHPSTHKHPEIIRYGRHGVTTASIPSTSDPSQTKL